MASKSAVTPPVRRAFRFGEQAGVVDAEFVHELGISERNGLTVDGPGAARESSP